MKRAGKRKILPLSRLGNRKGRKLKSNLRSSSSRKRSLVKRVGRTTARKTSISPSKVLTKQRKHKTRKVQSKSVNRSIRVHATKKIGLQKTKRRRNLSKKQTQTRQKDKKIIRVLGHGQFSVDSETLRKLNAIDDSIVRRIENEKLTDEDFKIEIERLEEIVTKRGKLLDPKVITSSDIILPGSNLTAQEANKIFHGEGIIPGLD